MKVRIGSIEISDVTLDELDELVKRYGNSAIQPPESKSGDQAPKPGGHSKGSSDHHGATTDQVVLQKVVEAGSTGLPTNTLGEMLGRRGKATRGAARQWAQRVGIVNEGGVDPFEECRVGTQRGLRLRSSLLDIAKAHMVK
jgi:hypothetical protein